MMKIIINSREFSKFVSIHILFRVYFVHFVCNFISSGISELHHEREKVKNFKSHKWVRKMELNYCLRFFIIVCCSRYFSLLECRRRFANKTLLTFVNNFHRYPLWCARASEKRFHKRERKGMKRKMKSFFKAQLCVCWMPRIMTQHNQLRRMEKVNVKTQDLNDKQRSRASFLREKKAISYDGSVTS